MDSDVCEKNDDIKNVSKNLCTPIKNDDQQQVVNMNPADDKEQVSEKSGEQLVNPTLITEESITSNKNTSLGLLATYGSSSSESDSDMDNANSKILKPVVTTNENPSKTKSSSETEDSESDSESDDDNANPINKPSTVSNVDVTKKIDGSYRVASSSDEENSYSDSDVEEISHADLDEFINRDRNSKKSKNSHHQTGEEGIENLPAIEELTISVAEDECIELGKITSIVEQLVLVDSLPGTVPLNLDTVLFLDKGNKALGKIFDVMGNIASPMYCVRFNSNEEIKMKNIEIGSIVYVAPRTEHTTFVCVSDLMKEKRSDASKENDDECSDDSEYSDDEIERQRKSIKLGKNKMRNDNNGQNVESNKYMRGTYRSPRGNRGYPGAFRRPQRGGQYQNYGHHRPIQHPSQQQPDNYYYSWHSNYQYQHQQQHQHPSMLRPLMFPNPYAMPPPQPYSSPYIPSNVMQQPLFPPPPLPSHVPKNEPTDNR